MGNHSIGTGTTRDRGSVFLVDKGYVMSESNKRMLRRQFQRSGLLSGLELLVGDCLQMNKSFAAAGTDVDTQMNFKSLIRALRSTGNAICMSTADRLEASRSPLGEYNLHMRKANLTASDAEIIARAISDSFFKDGIVLRSFSVSYNAGLKDDGVLSLVRAFPPTINELGFVECAIGDEGGATLLHWSKQATELRMICVEGNHFNSRIKRGFMKLAQERPNLLVVV